MGIFCSPEQFSPTHSGVPYPIFLAVMKTPCSLGHYALLIGFPEVVGVGGGGEVGEHQAIGVKIGDIVQTFSTNSST